MMNTIKRFWALCLDTHMKLALYKYAIIIIIITYLTIDNKTNLNKRIYVIYLFAEYKTWHKATAIGA